MEILSDLQYTWDNSKDKVDMKRKPKTSAITVQPPPSAAWAEAARIVPESDFAQLPFWQSLRDNERAQLKSESYQLFTARNEFGLTYIAMGQHLNSIHELLADRRGAFRQYMAKFKFAERTGYRLIKDYKRLLAMVKEPVLKVMLMTTDFKLEKATRSRPLGNYTEAYMALKMNSENPPATMDMEAAIRYVRKLQTQHERLESDPHIREIVQKKVDETFNQEAEKKVLRKDSYAWQVKQTWHCIKSCNIKLNAKEKRQFMDEVIGYWLHSQGISSKTFSAHVIPVELKHQGRPLNDDIDQELRFKTIEGKLPDDSHTVPSHPQAGMP